MNKLCHKKEKKTIFCSFLKPLCHNQTTEMDTTPQKYNMTFLAALSSTKSLIVGRLVGWSVGRSVGRSVMFVKRWLLEYQKVIKLTFLPTYEAVVTVVKVVTVVTLKSRNLFQQKSCIFFIYLSTYLPTYLCDSSYCSDSSDSSYSSDSRDSRDSSNNSEKWEKSGNLSTKKIKEPIIFLFFFNSSLFLERSTWHIWQPM